MGAHHPWSQSRALQTPQVRGPVCAVWEWVHVSGTFRDPVYSQIRALLIYVFGHMGQRRDLHRCVINTRFRRDKDLPIQSHKLLRVFIPHSFSFPPIHT